MSLSRHPQDVPLHVDVVLGQVDPLLHVVLRVCGAVVGVNVDQVDLVTLQTQL